MLIVVIQRQPHLTPPPLPGERVSLAHDGSTLSGVGAAGKPPGEARDIFRSYSLDLVFLDVELPGASGLELLPHFRDTDPQLPIVMVTHHSTQDVVVQALRQGAFGFIVKPYSLNKLKEIFTKLDRRLATEPVGA